MYLNVERKLETILFLSKQEIYRLVEFKAVRKRNKILFL